VAAASVLISVTLTIPDGSTAGGGAGTPVDASSAMAALNASMGTAAQASALLNVSVVTVTIFEVVASGQAGGDGGGGGGGGGDDAFLLGLGMVPALAIICGAVAALLLLLIALAVCLRRRQHALRMHGSFKPEQAFPPRAWKEAAASGQWAELQPLDGGPAVALAAAETTVGRDDVPDAKKGVSKRHFTVSSGTPPTVVDHSTNGLFLNGARLQTSVPAPLEHGDVLTFATRSADGQADTGGGEAAGRSRSRSTSGRAGFTLVLAAAQRLGRTSMQGSPPGPRLGDEPRGGTFKVRSLEVDSAKGRSPGSLRSLWTGASSPRSGKEPPPPPHTATEVAAIEGLRRREEQRRHAQQMAAAPRGQDPRSETWFNVWSRGQSQEQLPQQAGARTAASRENWAGGAPTQGLKSIGV
jgi:hypothetical protein